MCIKESIRRRFWFELWRFDFKFESNYSTQLISVQEWHKNNHNATFIKIQFKAGVSNSKCLAGCIIRIKKKLSKYSNFLRIRPIDSIFLSKSSFFLMFAGRIRSSRGPHVWDYWFKTNKHSFFGLKWNWSPELQGVKNMELPLPSLPYKRILEIISFSCWNGEPSIFL